MKIYIYAHYYKDETLPFYIGMGSEYRMNTKQGRNNRWWDYSEGQFTSEIIFRVSDTKIALNIEQHLTQINFDAGYCAGNIKAGNKYLREEDKPKGCKNPMYGQSVTKYMSAEQIKRWKLNLSKSLKGRTFSKETRKIFSTQKLGEGNPRFIGWVIHGPTNKKFASARQAAKEFNTNHVQILRWARYNKNGWSFEPVEK